MSKKRQLIATSCAAALGLGAVAQAAAPAQPAEPAAQEPTTEIAALERTSERFEQNLEIGALRLRYSDLLADARKLDAEPNPHLLSRRVATEEELADGIAELRRRIAKAERAAEAAASQSVAAAAPDAGAVAGVSTATLESIAACESGGDPGAVNPAGYYGKYQFDMGTWASVGGSGNPAEASEAEQDYRAALLYSRAGASPWPVCGA